MDTVRTIPSSAYAYPILAIRTEGNAADLRVQARGQVVQKAKALLNALVLIRCCDSMVPERLRRYLHCEIEKFETCAQQASIPDETVICARYCLCTALDEAVALTPWGSDAWPAHSLLVTFHNETMGGEKFFQLLARLSLNPVQNRELLELQYLCLALGFQGRYRLVEGGATQLEHIRQRLHALLAGVSAGYAQQLSLHWLDTRPAQTPISGWRAIPLWGWLLGAVLSGCMMYVGCQTALSHHADRTYALLASLSLPGNSPARAPRLTGLLEPDIRSGAITVHDLSDRSVIVINGDGLFDSGSTHARDSYLPVLLRVARALDSIAGADIVVTGYSDDQPIHTKAFSSNLALSEARAREIARLLTSSGISAAHSVAARGLGDADPVSSNRTPEGRARNRRVEIMLIADAGSRSALTGDPGLASRQNAVWGAR